MHVPESIAFTIPELMQAAKVGRTLIYEEIKAGHLRVAKLGKRTLVPVTEAQRWLASKMQPPKD